MASPQLSSAESGQNLGSFLSGGGADMGILPREEQQKMVRESYREGKEASVKTNKIADQLGALADQNEADGKMVPPKPAVRPLPVQKHTDPWETFGSSAMFLSTLGSLMTRRPLTNGLNAAAGLLNAKRAGDDAEYQKQLELMKYNNEEAFKMADFELNTYKAIQENKNITVNARVAELGAASAAFKNLNLSAVLANRGVGEADKLIEALNKNNERAKENHGKMIESEEKAKALSDWVNSPEYEALPPNKRMESINQLTTKGSGKSGSGGNIDQAVLNELSNYPGMTREDLGYIPATEQVKLRSEVRSIKNIEDIAKYVDDNPKAVGIAASAARDLNIDAIKHLFKDDSDPESVNEEASRQVDQNIDKGVEDGKYNIDEAGQAKILAKMLATQALNDAAAAGGRGATIYLDKLFAKLYQQSSSPEVLKEILRKRAEDSNGRLAERKMQIENRSDTDSFPFFLGGKKDKKGKGSDSNKSNTAADIFNDGGSKEYALPMPENKVFEIGKYYQTPEGVGKYLGKGHFE